MRVLGVRVHRGLVPAGCARGHLPGEGWAEVIERVLTIAVLVLLIVFLLRQL